MPLSSFISRNTNWGSMPSMSTSASFDEYSALLPHENGPALESQSSSPTHATRMASQHETQFRRPLHRYHSDRGPEIEHILSRIDTIEIGLWQDRIAHSESLATQLRQETYMGEDMEDYGERLSRVETYVAQPLPGPKSSSAESPTTEASNDLETVSCFFWIDAAGISLLGLLITAMLLYTGISLMTGHHEDWCGAGADGSAWVCVQILVSLAFGLLTQIPIRWVWPFVLPLWIVGVFGTMWLVRGWACWGTS